jgi:hypothetical protein
LTLKRLWPTISNLALRNAILGMDEELHRNEAETAERLTLTAPKEATALS